MESLVSWLLILEPSVSTLMRTSILFTQHMATRNMGILTQFAVDIDSMLSQGVKGIVIESKIREDG